MHTTLSLCIMPSSVSDIRTFFAIVAGRNFVLRMPLYDLYMTVLYFLYMQDSAISTPRDNIGVLAGILSSS